MYYWINHLLRELAWSILGLTDSAMLRGFIAFLPILMVYAIPVFFVKSASNYYKVHKEETGTVWLKISMIFFCIDGFWIVVFIHMFPHVSYPIGFTILEIILTIVLLVILLINSDAKIEKKLRLFLDTFIIGFGFFMFTNLCFALHAWGKDVPWLRWVSIVLFIVVSLSTLFS